MTALLRQKYRVYACAKRGKRGGKKQVYRSKGLIEEERDDMRLAKEAPPEDMVPLLKPMIIKGKIVPDFSFSLEEASARVQDQLKVVKL